MRTQCHDNTQLLPLADKVAISGTTVDELPGYAPSLTSRHIAHRSELQRIVDALPFGEGRRILDAPCGDGFFCSCLAARLHPSGCVFGVDISHTYIQVAVQTIDPSCFSIQFLQGNSYRLPFCQNSFDLAWCAQSLLSLKQPVDALSELRRVVRSGGHVAILEEDPVNEMHLPWPHELQEVIRCGEQRALERLLSQHAANDNPIRHLGEMLDRVGLKVQRRSTYAIERRHPLSLADHKFLEQYFSRLRDRIAPDLTRREQQLLFRLTNPLSDHYLPARHDFHMTWQEIVSVGMKQ
jgi:ubiquinone/menaquinone biosynthesis C-methylase UbiE